MKKILNTVVAVALSLLVGCAVLNGLTPAQITTIGVVITQTADAGASYAIQQDVKNATYFKLADQVLENFANGTDLSSAALQLALAPVIGTNQWVDLAISGVVIAYDISYSQYISGQLTNAPAAREWILAVDTGFKQALASTGTGLKRARASLPYFITADGKVNSSAIKDHIKAAAGKK